MQGCSALDALHRQSAGNARDHLRCKDAGVQRPGVAHPSRCPAPQTGRAQRAPPAQRARRAQPGGAAWPLPPCATAAAGTAGCCRQHGCMGEAVGRGEGLAPSPHSQGHKAGPGIGEHPPLQGQRRPVPHTPDQHRKVALGRHSLGRKQHQHLGVQHRLQGGRHGIVRAVRAACNDWEGWGLRAAQVQLPAARVTQLDQPASLDHSMEHSPPPVSSARMSLMIALQVT